MKRARIPQNEKRRGAVAVLTMIFLVTAIGFAALTVDVGAMYNTRSDLQDTADAAAMAAALRLAEAGVTNTLANARQAAADIALQNPGLQGNLQVDPLTDVQFGRANYDPIANSYTFTPTNTLPDAVRVQVRMAANAPNSSLRTLFASVFGMNSVDLSAEATALLAPRDIALAVDLSGSINDDSELRHYRITDINLFDVWANLPITRGVNGVGNGSTPPPPGDPNAVSAPIGFGPGNPASQAGNPDPGTDPMGGGQVGPTWAWMYNWGTTIDQNYDPVADPGLMYFPQYRNWNNVDLENWYAAVGYSAAEIASLESASFDRRTDSAGQLAWTNRVAVAIGLARWDSGIPGGLWETIPPSQRNNGNSNGFVSSGELTWLVNYPFPSGSWTDFIGNYMRSRRTNMYAANQSFRYQFGLKTFVNYLLEWQNSNGETPDLADTPHQPMQAVKDAVGFMGNLLVDRDANDQLSLIAYATTAHREVDLTNNFDAVTARVMELQAGYYDTLTNMGGALTAAIDELTGPRARSTARKVIVLLTDGIANVDDRGNYSTAGGLAHALAIAQQAADQNISIIAVSVGASADQSAMQQIADLTGGAYFHASGSINTYSAQLTAVFQAIAGNRNVQLIQ